MQSVLNFFTHIWLAVVDMMATWSPSSRAKAAKVVAWLFWHVVPKRRKVALTNLRLCFPDWSEEKREQVAKQCFFRLARAALDHSVLWKGSAEAVRDFVRFDEGVIERITSEENRPLIVIAPHFAGLDASGIALNLYVRGVSLYQRQTNPVWDKAAYVSCHARPRAFQLPGLLLVKQRAPPHLHKHTLTDKSIPMSNIKNSSSSYPIKIH